jgi:hypothetical protein
MSGSEDCGVPENTPGYRQATRWSRALRRGIANRPGSWLCLLALLWPLSSRSQIQNLYRITDGSFADHVEYHQVDLPPGKELVLADLSGPGKVTYLYYTDDSNSHRSEGTGFMYPGLVLKVYWDDALQPSIQVPLWNFFGAFERKTIDYQSLPMQINHYCYMSYLPMPFSKHARFVLANDGDEQYSRSVAWGIDYEKDPSLATEKSRLHASWTRSNPTANGMHRILEVQGRGQYVGNYLQVDTKYEDWWGEGDTIFQVDGEKLTHTPGTEDEYGSTWGFEHTYSYLYSGYIQMDDGKNRMYRWYLANPVRFQKSLIVDIQNQRYNGQQTPSQDDYTSVAFWYQEGAHPAPALLPYLERAAESKGATYPGSKQQ